MPGERYDPIEHQLQQRRLFAYGKYEDPYAKLRTGVYNPGAMELLGLSFQRFDMTARDQRMYQREARLRMVEDLKSTAISVGGMGGAFAGGTAGMVAGIKAGAMFGPIGGFVGGAVGALVGGGVTDAIYSPIQKRFARQNAIRREFAGRGDLFGVSNVRRSAGRITQSFNRMGAQDSLFSSDDLVEMASRFKDRGLLKQNQGLGEFEKNFKAMKSQLKDVMRTMGTGLEEATDMIDQMNQMGFMKPGKMAANMARIVGGTARSSGLSTSYLQGQHRRGMEAGVMSGFDPTAMGKFYVQQSARFERRAGEGLIDNMPRFGGKGATLNRMNQAIETLPRTQGFLNYLTLGVGKGGKFSYDRLMEKSKLAMESGDTVAFALNHKRMLRGIRGPDGKAIQWDERDFLSRLGNNTPEAIRNFTKFVGGTGIGLQIATGGAIQSDIGSVLIDQLNAGNPSALSEKKLVNKLNIQKKIGLMQVGRPNSIPIQQSLSAPSMLGPGFQNLSVGGGLNFLGMGGIVDSNFTSGSGAMDAYKKFQKGGFYSGPVNLDANMAALSSDISGANVPDMSGDFMRTLGGKYFRQKGLDPLRIVGKLYGARNLSGNARSSYIKRAVKAMGLPDGSAENFAKKLSALSGGEYINTLSSFVKGNMKNNKSAYATYYSDGDYWGDEMQGFLGGGDLGRFLDATSIQTTSIAAGKGRRVMKSMSGKNRAGTKYDDPGMIENFLDWKDSFFDNLLGRKSNSAVKDDIIQIFEDSGKTFGDTAAKTMVEVLRDNPRAN